MKGKWCTTQERGDSAMKSSLGKGSQVVNGMCACLSAGVVLVIRNSCTTCSDQSS